MNIFLGLFTVLYTDDKWNPDKNSIHLLPNLHNIVENSCQCFIPEKDNKLLFGKEKSVDSRIDFRDHV